METIKGYKAFGPGMVCRGKQYAENTVFEEDSAEICKNGMHYCTEPLDVLGYYPLVDEDGRICEFAEVEDLEPTGEANSDDSKRATKRLKINGKISFAELVNASTDIESIKETPIKNLNKDYAQIGSSDYSAQIGSSGDSAKIGSSGKNAVIATIGIGSIAKAKKGSWIVLAEYDQDGKPLAVVSKQVDGKEIKEDTFYWLHNGEFEEVNEN